jgi:uncharacterized protein YjbJ (UPF0337 family)
MPQDQGQLTGKLKQIKGSTKKQWGRLTDAELLRIKQRRDVLVGKIQKRYGQNESNTTPTE